jgi:hypothetical protein
MTAARMPDTRQCPYCRGWIPIPSRHAHAVFEAHKLACPCNAAVAVPRERHDAETPADMLCGRCSADIACNPFHVCIPDALDQLQGATRRAEAQGVLL